ncbi:nitroreductase family protein [Chloroflexota bacterium]
MNIDEFLELARKRRTIRKFKPDPVPDEYIEKIIEAARWAQSGANAQPWEFIIVKDKQIRHKISDIYFEQQKMTWDVEKTRIKEIRHRGHIDGPPTVEPGFKDAPVFILVCGDPRAVQATVLITHFLHNEGGPFAHFLKNIGNATQILTLAAAACGLTAQWVSVGAVTETRLKPLLDVPDEIAIHTIVPIGYPAYEAPPPYRRGLKEIMHFEKYDRSKYRSSEDIYDFLLALRQKTEPAYAKRFKS